MINEEISAYVESLAPPKHSLLLEMEQLAIREHVPIMDGLSLNTMLAILRVKQPKQILEIGTAIGYSAIRLAEALPSTTIVTLERDEYRYEQAKRFIERANLTERIIPYLVDAEHAVDLVSKHGLFDSMFIDAAKGKYQLFFEQYEPFLSENGVMISDNILFRGLVAQADVTKEPKRIQKLVEKIKRYNEWLSHHPNFHTSIVPVGDGIACSTRIKREEHDTQSK
ncbi:O-methyltransferase [Bacillus sp. Marseille-P3800]|uniref:O-methyltransferase n=1 Tax=Bacillus sp. Marseille-P3800 TaxID=2014782 RepID=UPI000C08131C|nr:O-methyltransferase [Bacillus sp. Marseille-P3800]